MLWFWVGFFALVALLLFLDLGVLHRKNEEPTFKSAVAWTAGWIALGLSFTAVVYVMYEGRGEQAAVTYLSAYLLEQALSVDNLFVIAVVFRKFRVPLRNQHRVLFWGILGAIVFRVAMLGGGVWVANTFDWVFYVFGAVLVFQGVKMLRGDDDEDPTKHPVVRATRRVVRIAPGDFDNRFVVHIDGRRYFTTLALCLFTVEVTDIIFAFDSIPAVLSISQDTFIVITSNIFAIMGLRSLYFVLAHVLTKFHYLKVALAFLLVGIGVKLALHNHVHVSHVVSLAAIAATLAIGITASILATRRNR